MAYRRIVTLAGQNDWQKFSSFANTAETLKMAIPNIHEYFKRWPCFGIFFK
jgi:hypothetical protein